MLVHGQRSRVRPVPVEQIRQSEEEWLRRNAERRSGQLDALDAIDQLQAIVTPVSAAGGRTVLVGRAGRAAASCAAFRSIRLGTPFELDPATGRVARLGAVDRCSRCRDEPAAALQ